jgi:hypothetical protein
MPIDQSCGCVLGVTEAVQQVVYGRPSRPHKDGRLRADLISSNTKSRLGGIGRLFLFTKPSSPPDQDHLAEMREQGVRGLPVYCADYHCSHSAVSGD